MSYELTRKKVGDVLHVKATGAQTMETVMAMSKDIMEACARHKTPKALVDVRAMEGKLSTMDAYELPKSFFETIRDRTVLQKSAIVDLKENEDRYTFLENVATNLGYILRFFSDLDEALQWLRE
jgi:hypothetical protein